MCLLYQTKKPQVFNELESMLLTKPPQVTSKNDFGLRDRQKLPSGREVTCRWYHR